MARINSSRSKSKFISLPSAQELAIMRNTEFGVDPAVPRRTAAGRGNAYGMTAAEAIGAAKYMDRSQVVSPLAGLPVSASSGDFAFAKSVFGAPGGTDGMWDEYWVDEEEGYNYVNRATGQWIGPKGQLLSRAMDSGSGRTPAPLTLVPTSTINPERPRTVAAGYAPKRKVLTVVFRDGTFYNYYDVDDNTWNAFKQAQSKGRFIASVLDYQPRGTASVPKSQTYAREQVYRIARTGQLTNDGQVAGQFDRTLAPRTNPTKSRARGAGKNPSKAKNPTQPNKNGMRRSK